MWPMFTCLDATQLQALSNKQMSQWGKCTHSIQLLQEQQSSAQPHAHWTLYVNER